MIGWWFLFLLTLKETKNLIHDKIVFEADNFIQMYSVLQHSFNLLQVFLFLLFYGKKVGQLSVANSRIQKRQTQMSKKPTTNEKLQFALTHTPAPQSCQIEISRHSWTPPHSFHYIKIFNFKNNL
jgi:hypothetical protein